MTHPVPPSVRLFFVLIINIEGPKNPALPQKQEDSPLIEKFALNGDFSSTQNPEMPFIFWEIKKVKGAYLKFGSYKRSLLQKMKKEQKTNQTGENTASKVSSHMNA